MTPGLLFEYCLNATLGVGVGVLLCLFFAALMGIFDR